MKKTVIIPSLIIFVFSFSLISAGLGVNFGVEDSVSISTTTYTGNLTNISEMNDVTITSPANGSALVWEESVGAWIDFVISGIVDTNAGTECADGEYLDGTGLCIDFNDTVNDLDDDTTYTAGSNLSLGGTEFSVDMDGLVTFLDTLYTNIANYVAGVHEDSVYLSLNDSTGSVRISFDEDLLNATISDLDTNTDTNLDEDEVEALALDDDFLNDTIDARDTDTNTNAETECGDGTYYDGAGICVNFNDTVSDLDTDTTYTAGSNLSLDGTEFSVDMDNLVSFLDTLYQAIGTYITQDWEVAPSNKESFA